MKTFALLLILCGAAVAAPNFSQSPNCDAGVGLYCVDTAGSGPTSVRIFYKWDQATDRNTIECGVAGWVTAAIRHEHINNDNDAQGRYLVIPGLAPSTAYECRVGGSATSDGTHTYTWSNRISYTTPARTADTWNVPTPPPVDNVSYPTVTGETLNATCATLQAQLDAASGKDQSLTHEVVLPAGSRCTGNFVIRNHKTGPGYLIFRSSAVGTTNFPPEGVRLDPSRYASSLAYLVRPTKVPAPGWVGFPISHTVADYGLSISDGSSYIRIVGITTEQDPTKNNWVYRGSTCTFTSGQDVSVNVVGSGGQGHNLLDGRTVKVFLASTLPGLVGNSYAMTSTGTNTFTLNGTSGVTGSTGSCNVAVLSDAELTSCVAGTASAPRCTTAVPHGLVSDTIVKVTGDLSAGFSSKTQYVDVIDDSTIEFRGSVFTGSYTPNSASVVMDGSTTINGFDVSRGSPVSTHVIFDRTWTRHYGPPFRASHGMRLECDHCAMIESYVDPNYQWVFTIPGTTTEQRAFGFTTNSYSVIVDNSNENLLMRNNIVGFTILGIAGGSNNSLPVPLHDITYLRNTVYYPEEYRADLTNPVWNGLGVSGNRQGQELKAQERSLYRGNRFYTNVAGQDKGSPFLISTRANRKVNNRSKNIVYEYNLSSSSAQGPTIMGIDIGDQPNDTPVSQYIHFRHNVFIVDGNRATTNNTTGQGHALVLGPMEDSVIDHNLFIQRGVQQSAIFLSNGGVMSGFKYRNNIVVYNQGPQPPFWKSQNVSGVTGNREFEYPDGQIVYPTTFDFFGHWKNSNTAIGQATPTVINGTSYPHLDPTTEFKRNVFITGVEGYLASCNTSTTAACNASRTECESALGLLVTAPYGSNMCWDAGNSTGAANTGTFLQRLGKIGFGTFDFTQRYVYQGDVPGNRAFSFWLNHSSPFKSGATSASNSLCASGLCMKATDGTDLGPDMLAMASAQGLVDNARVISRTTSTAVIGYYAPDSAACYVDTWAGSGTPARVSDGGGARVRNVTISGLTSATTYNYIIQCAVEQPSGTFTTR